jgi:hypothetical protein
MPTRSKEPVSRLLLVFLLFLAFIRSVPLILAALTAAAAHGGAAGSSGSSSLLHFHSGYQALERHCLALLPLLFLLGGLCAPPGAGALAGSLLDSCCWRLGCAFSSLILDSLFSCLPLSCICACPCL